MFINARIIPATSTDKRQDSESGGSAHAEPERVEAGPTGLRTSADGMSERRLTHLRETNDSTDLQLVAAYIGFRMEALGGQLEEMSEHPFAEYAGADDAGSDEMTWLGKTLAAIVSRETPLNDPDVLGLRDQALRYLLPKGMDFKEIAAKASSTLIHAMREQG